MTRTPDTQVNLLGLASRAAQNRSLMQALRSVRTPEEAPRGRPAGRTRFLAMALHYHKPSDGTRPDWDRSGALEDLRISFAVGRAADTAKWPERKPGSEFKARRDRMLGR